MRECLCWDPNVLWSRSCRQQHRRALRLVIKFLLCTVQYRHSTGTVQWAMWVWTPHYSISIIRAHTPHCPYSGTQLSLSPSWPTIHTMPHYRMTWYCVVACFRRLQSSLWQDGLVLAGVIWPWPDSRPLARARGGDKMFGPNTVVSCQPASKQNSFTAHNKALQTLAPGNHEGIIGLKHIFMTCLYFLQLQYV